jgi:hypothetical protein
MDSKLRARCGTRASCGRGGAIGSSDSHDQRHHRFSSISLVSSVRAPERQDPVVPMQQELRLQMTAFEELKVTDWAILLHQPLCRSQNG